MKKTIAIVSLLALLAGCTSNQPQTQNKSQDIVTETQSTSEVAIVNQNTSTDPTTDTSNISLAQDNISVNSTNVNVTNNVVTITAAGTYELSGELTNGTIVVDASNTDDVVLILNNVNITNKSGAAIYAKQSNSLTITLAENSSNTLTDGGNNFIYEDSVNEEPNAALYSRDDIVINGSGALVVNASFNNAIQSSDNLVIESGNITLVAANHGLKGNDNVTINGGSLNINAGNDGIKTDNTTDTKVGNIVINGGSIVVNSQDDAITADNKITINGGTIDIQSSVEGIEAQTIEQNGGSITIISSDDAINASGELSTSQNYQIVINGGELAFVSGGDGLDSNGSITINDGFVLAIISSSADNGSMDADYGTTINGGTVVFGGTGTGQASINGQGVVTYFGSLSKGSVLSLTNGSETLFSFTLPYNVSTLSMTSSTVVSGQSYQLLVNNSTATTLQATDSVQGGMMGGPGGQKR